MESLLFDNNDLDESPIDNNLKPSNNYLVLARKYRPINFSDMIGQDILIRTFTNAIASKRIAHAFLLTGIRGVGKTTTARIIARALNCIGKDGNGDVSIHPCGKCPHCISIAEDRHHDVIEIDAASHTGVGDIREIIENARYRPVSARFKVYIIDEVHMLSNNAFNALLKTLEEPPQHVKFIFATTEIKKIPLTILSRCQRFDLRRVESDELIKHFQHILKLEGFKASENCLRIIANASGGSVRDGLSILDQALSHTDGKIDEISLREMLGLSSHEDIYKIYENLLKHNIQEVLNIVNKLYDIGSDPILILQDIMNITHQLTKGMIDKTSLKNLPEFDRLKLSEFLNHADLSRLNRIWQALVKGFDEVKHAVNTLASIEMVLIRIMHLSNLPSPEEIIKRFQNSNQNVGVVSSPLKNVELLTPNIKPSNDENSIKKNVSNISCLRDIEQVLYDNDEMILCHHVRNDIRFVSIDEFKLTVKFLDTAPKNLSQTLKSALDLITGETWCVINSDESGDMTLAYTEKMQKVKENEDVINDPSVKAMLNAFTGLEIADIKLKNVI